MPMPFLGQEQVLISIPIPISCGIMTPSINRSTGLFLILAAFFGFFSSPVNAQFNLKAGYNISFLSDPAINDIMDVFADSREYTSSFHSFGWMHGFEAGLRIKSDVHAFELTYQNGYQPLKAKGTNADGTTYTDKIKLGVNSAAFGYQVAGDLWGFGADLQYQWYRTTVELHEQTNTFKNVQEMWGTKLYLMLTLRGSGNIDAALQPYVVLPFGSYDHDPLSIYLNQTSGPAPKKWTRFGLTFLFYNGNK
jgi:hypothetical protein